jgi:pimeloyl-ACP methyl ester carboxylesterase
VVSRGGRPDLAGGYLSLVRAPTLLIVGGADPEVLELNHQALCRMSHLTRELIIVPRATHLFEEPGAMELVLEHARRWFCRHLHA